jgi:ABC-type multidrug transport system permease subunit
MPAVTRWFIKAGLVYVVAALLLGVVLAASAVLQWLAGMVFVVNTWARVKER